MVGTTVIQEYNGDYMRCMTERDFSTEKKNQFDIMSGNTSEFNEPENYENRRLFYVF